MKAWLLLLSVSLPSWAQPTPSPTARVTEQSYNYWIDRAQATFAPYIAIMGHKLIIQKNWESSSSLVSTNYAYPPVFEITFNGGAFRNAETTNDGMAYTLCHEISHIIGGSPKYVSDSAGYFNWGSAEGQADYIATNICLKQLFDESDNLVLIPELKAPAAVQQMCEEAYTSKAESALCQRSVMAGYSYAANNRRIKIQRYPAPLSLTKREKTVVRELNRSYSSPQCRLDTAIAGALCSRGYAFQLEMLNDHNSFNCGRADVAGSQRPACWFK